jgi:hypothetical protein
VVRAVRAASAVPEGLGGSVVEAGPADQGELAVQAVPAVSAGQAASVVRAVPAGRGSWRSRPSRRRRRARRWCGPSKRWRASCREAR